MHLVPVLSVYLWVAVGVALFLFGVYAALAVRRWAHREDQSATFTFQDLRDMRARGEISEQEFASVRNALLARLETDLQPPAPPAAPAPPADDAPPPPS